ncbi:hypothetical protein Vretimale_9461 [Volvox reticuliferus]|uniref:Uncharacterized protein n=1 Tax=Volvox reticuliferus TaxID=1737510 RepID=A0A8J4GCT4_9CHLO|nr:hypothetical protein Vretimale_9461 [Volvox reticuliferus]
MEDDTFPAGIFLNIKHSTGGANRIPSERDVEIPMQVEWTAQSLENSILRGRPTGTVVFGGQAGNTVGADSIALVALAFKCTFQQGFRTTEEAEKARRRFIARYQPRGDVSFSSDFLAIIWTFYCFEAEGTRSELPTVGTELSAHDGAARHVAQHTAVVPGAQQAAPSTGPAAVAPSGGRTETTTRTEITAHTVITVGASFSVKDLKAAYDVLGASGQKQEVIAAAKLAESACRAAFNDLRRRYGAAVWPRDMSSQNADLLLVKQLGDARTHVYTDLVTGLVTYAVLTGTPAGDLPHYTEVFGTRSSPRRMDFNLDLYGVLEAAVKRHDFLEKDRAARHGKAGSFFTLGGLERSLDDLRMNIRKFPANTKSNESGPVKGVNDPKKAPVKVASFIEGLKLQCRAGSSVLTGFSVVGGSESQRERAINSLKSKLVAYKARLTQPHDAMKRASLDEHAFLEGVHTHLQYVIENFLFSADSKGSFPIDVLTKCPVTGNGVLSGMQKRRGMYLEYGGRLARRCKRDSAAPIGLLLALGACDTYIMAGRLIDEYNATRARDNGPPLAGSVTAASRMFFGLGPERERAATQLAADERQVPVNQEQANAGAAVMPLDRTAAALVQEVATALPDEGELRPARPLLATARELHRTASQVGNSPALMDQGPTQQQGELQVAAGATVEPDQTGEDTPLAAHGAGANMGTYDEQEASEDNMDPAEKAWLTAPLPNPTLRAGKPKQRRQRDDDDDDMGAGGGRKKQRRESGGRARGRGASTGRRGMRRAASNRRRTGDDAEEEEEEEEEGEAASGDTSASSSDMARSSGVSSGTGSSGGHAHQPEMRSSRRGTRGALPPVTARTKQAVCGKQGTSSRRPRGSRGGR